MALMVAFARSNTTVVCYKVSTGFICECILKLLKGLNDFSS